jgi:hypothetical protein
MRKEEKVRLLIEQAHTNGTTTQEWKEYTIKVSYDAWIKATVANMIERNQRILEIRREGFPDSKTGNQPTSELPRSKTLF